MEGESNIEKLQRRHESLVNYRRPWETLWEEAGDLFMPRRAYNIGSLAISPSIEKENRLFDTTGVRANQTLAAGQLSWMSPKESRWFAFEPPEENKDDKARKWLAEATRRVQLALSRNSANFYTAIHECYLDRGAFGTCALWCEPNLRGGLRFRPLPIATYAIDEDADGMVDTVFRDMKMTVRQIVQEFGLENVSQRTKEGFLEGGHKLHEKCEVIHAVYPRTDDERKPGSVTSDNLPIASVYYEKAERHILRDSGYEEMPVMVSRYLEWSSGFGHTYGWCPAFLAMPDARQVNFLQKMMDAIAEKMAVPPVLAPDEMKGDIDATAGGVTYYSKDLAASGTLPTEWMTGGRYDIGLQRVQERQQAINDAFHVDLFKMFAEVDKQMTAREVMERSQERLTQFSPTFDRVTSELLEPALERAFGIMLRSGELGMPPASLIRPTETGDGFIDFPNVEFSGRIALALRALPAVATLRTMETIGAVVEMEPRVMNHFDLPNAVRDMAITDGFPIDHIRSKSEVRQIEEAQTAAAAAERQAEQQAQAAEAAAKVGSIQQDSALAETVRRAPGNAA